MDNERDEQLLLEGKIYQAARELIAHAPEGVERDRAEQTVCYGILTTQCAMMGAALDLDPKNVIQGLRDTANQAERNLRKFEREDAAGAAQAKAARWN